MRAGIDGVDGASPRRAVLLAFVVATLGALLAPLHGSAEDLSVKLAGLRVVGPGYGDNGSEVQAFRESSGLTLALVVEAPAGKSIVEIDSNTNRLDAFSDDLGTDLRQNVQWGFFPQITGDGRHGLIEISVGARPAPGAKRLALEGSLALRLAGQTTSQKLVDLTFEPGTVFEVEGGKLKVEVAGKDEEWEGGVRAVLGTNTALNDTIRDLRFLDASGEAIDTQGSGQTTIGSQVQREVYLSTETLPVGLEVDRFEGLESLVVPFRLEAGLGLER